MWLCKMFSLARNLQHARLYSSTVTAALGKKNAHGRVIFSGIQPTGILHVSQPLIGVCLKRLKQLPVRKLFGSNIELGQAAKRSST